MLFRVAQHLTTPVYVLENEMPYEELIEWGIVFELQKKERKKLAAQREHAAKKRGSRTSYPKIFPKTRSRR